MLIRLYLRHPEWFFIAVLLLGILIRLYLAFHAPVDIDENFYAFDGHLLDRGLTPFQDYPTRSPLMILTSAAVLGTGGDFFTLRLLTVAVSSATGVLVYLSGKKLSGRNIGTIAAVIFLLSPYSIRYGYTFITQPFEALGAALSFYLLILYLQRGSSRNRLLLLGGLVLALTVFVRRTALVLFPAELLILYLCPVDRSEGTGRPLGPILLLTGGFLGVFIPALLLLMHITGISYTVYFFGADYIQAHTSIVENMNYTFTAFDTRAFYLLSPGMVFITLLLYRAGMQVVKRAGEKIERTARHLLTLLIILGWLLAAFSLLGNNYIDAGGGWGAGVVLLLIMIAGFLLTALYPRFHGRPLTLSTLGGLAILALVSGEFYPAFDAVILLNILAVSVLFYYRLASEIHFTRNGRLILLYTVMGVYLLSILLFYLLFRVMLPYYYDLLFPLSLITALLFRDILRFGSVGGRGEEILRAGKALFAATLLLSLAVSVTAYSHESLQSNQLDLGELRECSHYLSENGREGEEILTAKPVIALQAGMEVVFNIVRAGIYRENNSELLRDYHYPTVEEIRDYLEEKKVRFVIVEPELRECLLDVYPVLRAYITAHYYPVRVFGQVEVWQRG